MKRGISVILAVLISGIFLATDGKAGVTYEPGYSSLATKAGQEALAIRETKLKKLSREIDEWAIQMVTDGKADGKEMQILVRKVKDFDTYKKLADRWLKIYNLTTQTKLNLKAEKLVELYTEPLLRHRDRDGKVRKLLAGLTSQDVVVEEGFNWDVFRILMGIFVLSFLLFCVGTEKCSTLFIIGGIGALVSCILLVLGLIGI